MGSKDSRYASMLYVGFVLVVGGFVGTGLCFLLGMPVLIIVICILASIAGLIFLGITLSSGLLSIRKSGSAKQVLQVNNARIIARFATNANGETLFDENFVDFDDEKTRLYIRLQIPARGSEEYRCNRAVWAQCGEGMTGTAFLQGDWIGQFIFTPIAPNPGKPYGRP